MFEQLVDPLWKLPGNVMERTEGSRREQCLAPAPTEARRLAVEFGEALDQRGLANACLAAYQHAMARSVGNLVEQASKIAQELVSFEEVSAQNTTS